MHSAIPALPTSDVPRTIAFYRDTLGFALTHQDDGFAILRRDIVELHLWGATDDRWRDRLQPGTSPITSGAESFLAGTASCRIQVQGIDRLHGEIHPHGVLHPNAPLTNQPWGTREFGVLDPDGNLITFFERLYPNADPSAGL